MGDSIEALEGVISDLESAINSDLVRDMQNVVDEWIGYIRPHLVAMSKETTNGQEEIL